MSAATRLDVLRERLPLMLDQLAELVSVESPSGDLTATAAAVDCAAAWCTDLLGGTAEVVTTGERRHLRWSGGGPTRVLLLGHLDTVWPLGTLARWPFASDGVTATGPGIFDMKAGVIQGLHALATLGDRSGVSFLLTTDEETGSASSRELIEDSARGALATLVLEPSAAGALKSARKGVSLYRVVVSGRAAHAGLEPEKGANAALELAHQLLALPALADPSLGTTVTPTVVSAGTTTNTVPAHGSVAVDVRVADPAEQQRVDEQIRTLRPVLEGTGVSIEGGPNRPPLPISSSQDLLAQGRAVAQRLGLPDLRDVTVGGGSDGNFTAGLGIPTLDGLGAVGDGAHAEGEHVLVAEMAERAALVGELVTELLAG